MSNVSFAGAVVVGVDQCYSDNNGAFDVVHVWSEGEVVSHTLRDNDGNVTPKVNATEEQKAVAGDWMQSHSKDVNVRNGCATYIGCTVILQRSRKAPNKVALDVINHKDRQWNGNYMRYDEEQICVKVNDAAVWVSVGCIKEVVKYRRPWWAKSN